MDYDPSDKIEEFTNEGYELASKDLDINGVKPTYDDDGHIYYIGFHHGTTVLMQIILLMAIAAINWQ
ncbi:mucin-binding protein [Lactobacillus helveticus]|uniref:mucin-binding protein n=1 Tax=Lactobacillus helveticus TaxID=1587 RepID=UPI001300C5F2|nr:hypothetical protein [Lactobacillus helveticus]